MTIISGETLRQFNPPVITPFMPRTRHNGVTFGCGNASYDVRLAQDLQLGPGRWRLADIETYIKINPRGHRTDNRYERLFGKAHLMSNGLFSTVEYFDMPRFLCGFVKDKSTWARRFLFVQNTFIDPGWRGYLTMEITNDGYEAIKIPAGTGIAQIVFCLIDRECEAYEGKYQDQAAEAVAAIMEEEKEDGHEE